MDTCEFCIFRREVIMPGAVTKQSVCAHSAPVAMMLPAPGGAQLIAVQPPLPTSQWCGNFTSVQLFKSP